MSLLVSVIITTRNEEINIANCLESVKNQSYPKEEIEIIVVDNASFDKTKEIARRYSNKVYNFAPERSAQKNFGTKKAEGKYILYLDADMVLSKDVIKECVNTCEKQKFSALYIPERIIGKGFWINVRDFERSFYNATSIDSVRFVRRDRFLEVNGFDENLTGTEDWDFDRRIRQLCRVGIIESPIYHNEKKFNFKKYINKKSYYIPWMDKYIQKWGRNDPIIKKQLGFWYRYFKVFMEKNKWRRLLHRPVLALSMYFLKFVIGLCYLRHRWAV